MPCDHSVESILGSCSPCFIIIQSTAIIATFHFTIPVPGVDTTTRTRTQWRHPRQTRWPPSRASISEQRHSYQRTVPPFSTSQYGKSVTRRQIQAEVWARAKQPFSSGVELRRVVSAVWFAVICKERGGVVTLRGRSLEGRSALK